MANCFSLSAVVMDGEIIVKASATHEEWWQVHCYLIAAGAARITEPVMLGATTSAAFTFDVAKGNGSPLDGFIRRIFQGLMPAGVRTH